MKKSFFHTLAIITLLVGCTMVPKYERPQAPVSDAWPNATTSTNAEASQIDWQEFFHDPRLQDLITIALQNNRDLRIAALRVEQARAQYRIQRAALYPGVQGEAKELRQKTSGTVSTFNSGITQTTYTVDVGAAYEIDLFGRIRSLKKEALERSLCQR